MCPDARTCEVTAHLHDLLRHLALRPHLGPELGVFVADLAPVFPVVLTACTVSAFRFRSVTPPGRGGRT